ncbi:hypothetical protein GCM10020219_043210 [Nonomuraea dietziae]
MRRSEQPGSACPRSEVPVGRGAGATSQVAGRRGRRAAGAREVDSVIRARREPDALEGGSWRASGGGVYRRAPMYNHAVALARMLPRVAL